jgi:hypothetical protein
VKIVTCLTALIALALGPLAATAQTAPPKTNASQAAAIELLRRTLAEQQANPDKIIRTTSNPPVAPAVALSPEAAASRAALERQYLDGKLSARQYLKALALWDQEQKQRAAAEAAKPRTIEPGATQHPNKPAARTATAKPEVQRATSAKTGVTTIVTPPPGAVTPPSAPAEPTPQQKKISDVESRLDEMLRLKAAREKAALTNATAVNTNLPATPQTRRQRLDAILKQNLEGKLSDTDYQAQRARILAEPE